MRWALALCLVTGCATPRFGDDLAPGFSVVVLPDTQNYFTGRTEALRAQFDFILRERVRLDVQAVLHEGDIVDLNSEEEWSEVSALFAGLDGVVPYVLTVGNHDLGAQGRATDRASGFDRFFPVERRKPTGVCPGAPENAFHTFQTRGRTYLVLALEWGPRAQVVAWAKEVIEAHPSHTAILLTHAYLCVDARPCNHRDPRAQKYNPHDYGTAALPGGTHDGQELYDALVVPYENVRLVLSGHIGDGGGAARRTLAGDRHELLANYQTYPYGGGGLLRVLRFTDDGRLQVRTYSPFFGVELTGDAHRFELPFPPRP